MDPVAAAVGGAAPQRLRVGPHRLCRDPSSLSADLVSHDFAVERICAALPRDHRLAAADEVGLDELSGDDFVMPDAVALPGLSAQLQLACHDAGFMPRCRAVADDLTGLFSYVASGLCVSLLPAGLAGFAAGDVAFVALRGDSPYLETRVVGVHRPGVDAAVLRLLEMISRRMAG
ncbi:LysR family substrate-binding domain-containing protein [Kitasatospora sp. HPMI-4]|uniref:LysR family substrate-binding domain-containing protein n=1 Tax=Kitasatospora sp. HPMI-4 TaxID=3448443 RepID=UPI003F1B716F